MSKVTSVIESSTLPTGTTLRLTFFDCRCDPTFLTDWKSLEPRLEKAILASSLTPLEIAGVNFDGGGCSACVVLAESHLALHSWPEVSNTVLLELSVCDYLRSNKDRTRALGERLVELFAPARHFIEECPMVSRLSEIANDGYGYGLNLTALLDWRNTAYQKMVIADTEKFGRALVLDDVIQTTEKDHHWYHEPLVHIPMLSHEDPRRVLIVGGGDGGAARAVLRHPTVERCVLAEIDGEVVEACRRLMPGIHGGVFDEERLEVSIGDGKAYLEETKERFDVILLDLTDPKGPSTALFEKPFHELIRSRLASGGILGLQGGAIGDMLSWIPANIASLRGVFPRVYPYTQHVPSYAAVMCFCLCFQEQADLPSRGTIRERLRERRLHHDLMVVTAETFHAMFALAPAYSAFLETGEGVLRRAEALRVG